MHFYVDNMYKTDMYNYTLEQHRIELILCSYVVEVIHTIYSLSTKLF